MLLLVAFAAETNFPFVGKLLVLTDMGSAVRNPSNSLDGILNTAALPLMARRDQSRRCKLWSLMEA
jgi:hypothetical protein